MAKKTMMDGVINPSDLTEWKDVLHLITDSLAEAVTSHANTII